MLKEVLASTFMVEKSFSGLFIQCAGELCYMREFFVFWRIFRFVTRRIQLLAQELAFLFADVLLFLKQRSDSYERCVCHVLVPPILNDLSIFDEPRKELPARCLIHFLRGLPRLIDTLKCANQSGAVGIAVIQRVQPHTSIQTVARTPLVMSSVAAAASEDTTITIEAIQRCLRSKYRL